MRINKILSLFILLPILLMNVTPTSGNFSVFITITDAYYLDADLDGFQDDVFVSIDVDLYNSYIVSNVEIYIGITLPSGLEFWFVARFDITKYTYAMNFSMEFDLLNTALEAGWYTASAVGFVQGDRVSVIDRLIFDPPGEGPGDPSSGTYVILY